MYLKRGGRISATTAVLGTVMQIKPVMHMDNDGHLANVTKARGRKGSLIALAEKALTTSTDLPSQTMFICHGDCYDDAKFVADYIRERSKVQDIIINYVGPVIGSHTGPGVVSGKIKRAEIVGFPRVFLYACQLETSFCEVLDFSIQVMPSRISRIPATRSQLNTP